jgi:cytochrome c-type biogenesis protein CcmF
MFAAAGFVVAVVAQEVWRAAGVRSALTGHTRLAALRAVIAGNRRRYGGYVVHIGMAVIFVALAASSAFQHISELQLTPGQSATLGGYRFRYVRPTASVTPQKVSLGAILSVSKRGHTVVSLSPSMGYYPIINAGLGPVASYMDGNAESAIGLNAGLRRDLWTSIDPDLDSFQSMISGIDSRFPRAGGDTQRLLLSIVAARYVQSPPPATFRFIVSPLVEWIWLGGLIAAGGALLALWPAHAARRRRRAQAPGRVGLGIVTSPMGETAAS